MYPRADLCVVTYKAQKLISENAIAIFSKSYCPFCKRAKEVISGLSVEPSKIGTLELDEVNDGPEIQVCWNRNYGRRMGACLTNIQNYLAEKTGQRTVPNIFISGKHVGGCDALLRAQQSGELQQMVGKL